MTMKVMMFSVYDKAAGAYMPVFFTNSKGLAIRSFMDAVSNGEHQFAKHPQDYALWYIGYFDDTDGRVYSPKDGAPEYVMGAVECIKSSEFAGRIEDTYAGRAADFKKSS